MQESGDEGEESDESSVSSDSEPDNKRTPLNIPKRNSDAAEQRFGSTFQGSMTGKPIDLAKFDPSRRSSLALADATKDTPSRHVASAEEEYFERQYDTALAYSLDFLGDMLTPPRSACNRKFEIIVDELVFIGHPITNGPDGNWRFPEENDDDNVRHSARARRRGRDDRDRSSQSGPNGNLRTVTEAKETTSPETKQEEPSARTPSEEKDGPPNLNMFHLVIVLDRPDPTGNGLEHDTSVNNVSDEIYREIAFKWTAAAFALQVKDNWIAKHSWDIVKLKEQCFNEGTFAFFAPHAEGRCSGNGHVPDGV
jgi:hypothetical protein